MRQPEPHRTIPESQGCCNLAKAGTLQAHPSQFVLVHNATGTPELFAFCAGIPNLLVAVDEALNRLAEVDARKSKVVELRFSAA